MFALYCPSGCDRLTVNITWGVAMITNPFSMTQPEPMLEHEIRLRAYYLYTRRGACGQHALDDWLQAEAEVLHEKCAMDFSCQISMSDSSRSSPKSSGRETT
jgi:hypothetical protein